jgi:hypothetical protein
MISRLMAVARVGKSVVGPVIDADAPVASESESPAAPKSGAAFRFCFRFERSFPGDMERFLRYL